jgi:hypothetical protein
MAGEVHTEFGFRDLLEDPSVNGKLIIRWIYRNWVGDHRID